MHTAREQMLLVDAKESMYVINVYKDTRSMVLFLLCFAFLTLCYRHPRVESYLATTLQPCHLVNRTMDRCVADSQRCLCTMTSFSCAPSSPCSGSVRTPSVQYAGEGYIRTYSQVDTLLFHPFERPSPSVNLSLARHGPAIAASASAIREGVEV